MDDQWVPKLGEVVALRGTWQGDLDENGFWDKQQIRGCALEGVVSKIESVDRIWIRLCLGNGQHLASPCLYRRRSDGSLHRRGVSNCMWNDQTLDLTVFPVACLPFLRQGYRSVGT
jgi:hypothetical protein